MATPFLKIDLSPDARDFEQVALEPGIPLLDRNQAHYRILKKWLGRWLAEPEWNGSEVSFFVSDEAGARPHGIRCEPALPQARASVKGLKDDFQAIERRLTEANPEPNEAKLHRAILRHWNASTSGDAKLAEFHFFRYQDGSESRLVWCWGHQRKDQAPATSVICTNPNCRLLFLRRQNSSRDCPACASQVAPPVQKGRRSWKGKSIAALIILAILAGTIGYFARDWVQPERSTANAETKPGIIATPTDWSGPTGSRLDYSVVRRDEAGKEEDVSNRVVIVSEDPKVVRVERNQPQLIARSAGKTAIHFYLGDEETHATVNVTARSNPSSLTVTPAETTIGVGTVTQFKVVGTYGQEQPIDLTDSVEWQLPPNPCLAGHAGRFEGLSPGEATVTVRYRATSQDPYITAEARVTVVDESYEKLEISANPSTFSAGGFAQLTIDAINKSGDRRSALGSSKLAVAIEPAGSAAIDGDHVRGLVPGKSQLRATFRELQAETEITIEEDASDRFIVSPKDLQLAVGEQFELQLSSSKNAPVSVTSSDPSIVEVGEGLQVIGRAAGKAELTIRQESQEAKVQVSVAAAEITAIAFEPSRISVPIGGTAILRLVARTDDEQVFDIAADTVVWEQLPQAATAELNLETLEVRGLSPTADTPQIVVARWGDARAEAEIEVVSVPFRLAISPSGPVDLAVGQSVQLNAAFQTGSGETVTIEPARLQWRLTPTASAELPFDPSAATARADKAGGKLVVVALYQGFESNGVELRSVGRPLSIAVEGSGEKIVVGDQGTLRAVSTESPLEISVVGTQFESAAPAILAVTLDGQYHALAPGKAKVTARHPQAQAAAEAEFEVIADDNSTDEQAVREVVQPAGSDSQRLTMSPSTLHLQVGELKRLGTDVQVQRGQVALNNDLTAESANEDIVRFNRQDRTLEGRSPGETTVAIIADGKAVSLPVVVQAGTHANGKLTVEPADATLRIGEYKDLQVLLTTDGNERLDQTGSASFKTSDPSILSVSEHRITALAEGSASIEASLPGIAEGGKATFKVVSDEITAVQVQPSPLQLEVGEHRLLEITAVGKDGQYPLGSHPELKVTVSGGDPSCVELSGLDVRAASPGKASLQVTWRGVAATPVEVEVRSSAIAGLRIDPPVIRVGVGETQSFAVYARHGESETLLSAADGLRLAIEDTSVAGPAPPTAVTGLATGSTNLAARFGSQRAAARIVVSRRGEPGETNEPALATRRRNSGGPRTNANTPGVSPTSLRFIPDVLTMQLGTPPVPARLVQVYPDGSVRDVDRQPSFELSPTEGKDVAEITWSASGPLVATKKTGEVDVTASLQELTTANPLKVVVIDTAPNAAQPSRLEVTPDPLVLNVGDVTSLTRVRFVPPVGEPVAVGYQLESASPDIVAVESANRLRGVAPGQARVSIKPLNLPAAYGNLTTAVTVTVVSPTVPDLGQSRLVLTGPSQTNVGARTSFRVELADNQAVEDVTLDGAALVLDTDQTGSAELLPGCKLVANQPMTLTLRARYRSLISNPLTVNVRPLSEIFARIELDIQRTPMAIGEQRTYRVWGYVQGSDTRQELTHRVVSTVPADGSNVPVVRVAGLMGADANIVAHSPPTIAAKSAGRFAMRADYGTLKSSVVEIDVAPGTPSAIQLFVDPPSVTIGVGQQIPALHAIGTTADGRQARPVEAQWTSENEAILAPVPGASGGFVGKSPGQARLKATFQGQEAAVEVTVRGEAFERVTIGERPEFQSGNRFLVRITVQTSSDAGSGLEFRTVAAGTDPTPWLPAPPGAQQKIELTTPSLPRGADDAKYQVMLEARDKQQQIVARYPLSFRLNITTIPTVETNE